VYQSIEGTLTHTITAIERGQTGNDVLTEAHIGQVTVRSLRTDPSGFTSDDAIIANGPMRLATLAVLTKTQSTLAIERIRERIAAVRTIRPSQRKRLAGQGGIQSWEHQVSNHLVRLQKEDLVTRTGFGEYEATSKGRKVLEELKKQAKRIE
jgi:predicted transcriptional regulator